MDLKLEGKVVVVTGGSSGIGLATVDALTREGARVVTCSRDVDKLDAAITGLEHADQVTTTRCNVREGAEVEALAQLVAEKFGVLDGVVNNAGGSRMSPLEKMTTEDWHDELDLKFAPVLNAAHHLVPLMADAEAPSMVNLNAVLAKQPEPKLVATSAARAGLLNLSKSLATRLADDGIRVNSVCLGLVDTGQWQRRYEADGSGATFEEYSAEIAADRGIALGRFGRADEVSPLITFLLSPVSSYITGTSIDVAGGVNRYV